MNEVILQSILDMIQVEGRGSVVIGPIGAAWRSAQRGDRIELRTPDGRRVQSAIKDMEIFAKGKLAPEPIPICGVLLADTFTSDQLPQGTEMLRILHDTIT